MNAATFFRSNYVIYVRNSIKLYEFRFKIKIAKSSNSPVKFMNVVKVK